MLKKVGSWFGSIKRYINDVQNQVSSVAEEKFEENINEVKKDKSKKDFNE